MKDEYSKGILKFISDIGCVETLEKFYTELERLRLRLWYEINKLNKKLKDGLHGLDEKDKELMSQNIIAGKAWVERDGVIRLIINDYPPRDVITNYVSVRDKFELEKNLKEKWKSSVTSALMPVGRCLWEKALCVIKYYLPAEIEWDVDNRLHKYIINGIVQARVLKNDSWQNMSFMVIGDVDKKYPRTEVTIINLEKYDMIAAEKDNENRQFYLDSVALGDKGQLTWVVNGKLSNRRGETKEEKYGDKCPNDESFWC